MLPRISWTILTSLAFTLLGSQLSRAEPPTNEQRRRIDEQLERLSGQLRELTRQNVSPVILTDIEVYAKAAGWIVRHEEWQAKGSPEWTLKVLDRALLRASQAARGEAPWLSRRGQTVVRGFQSRIDGSVQPYAVTLPRNYAQPKEGQSWRLDVVLHGRDGTLTEVKFLHRHASSDAPEDQDFVLLEVYGRGNNAYRWAGETDVFEAMEHFLTSEAGLGRGGWIDPNRVVLRGFSMGGAGAWHIGLHHPSRWAAIGPGAGFTRTHGYVSNLPERLPEYQEKCLHIYDAMDYAANASQVPVVAYAGSEDRQLQAARNIQQALEGTDTSIKLLVAPGLGHQFPPEWQKKAEAEYRQYVGEDKGREPFPKRVQFVTYTLKYPVCDWVELLGLEQHYQRAEVDAARVDGSLQVRTTNITALRLAMPPDVLFPPSVTIDGQEVDTDLFSRAFSRQGHFVKDAGTWKAVLGQRWYSDRLRSPRKVSGLQGPIDDAFMSSFVCVRGGRDPWHPEVVRATDAVLEQFGEEWDKFLRGKINVKRDHEVTDVDIANSHLILFGDPGSNDLIAQVLDRLPVEWTNDTLKFAGQEFDPASHYPVFIFPNPLNPQRYVVLNSGHTFHAEDFRGTNALLFPRLGDYAIMRIEQGESGSKSSAVTAGLFGEDWSVPSDQPE